MCKRQHHLTRVGSGAGVLAGLFWLQKGKNNTVLGAQQTIGLVFFELLFLSFRALFVALFTFPDERKMLLKASFLYYVHPTCTCC